MEEGLPPLSPEEANLLSDARVREPQAYLRAILRSQLRTEQLVRSALARPLVEAIAIEAIEPKGRKAAKAS